MSTQVVENFEILNGRYKCIRELGRGAQGYTLLADDMLQGEQVALKVLDFGQVESLKALELFERETQALKKLQHQAIPAYRDTFHITQPDGHITRYYLVQEYIEGETLAEQVLSGRRFDEASVRKMLGELLVILEYLHGFSPPVVHRDLKPSNIIARADTGQLVLIDFGAVQQTVMAEIGSSTIIGTSGYVPFEQMMGRAEPASDLYALGATAVNLLSRRSPSELLRPGMELSYRRFVNISDEFADYLDHLLAPHLEDRFRSATDALYYLNNLGRPFSAQQPFQRELAPKTSPESDRGVIKFRLSEEEKQSLISNMRQRFENQYAREGINQRQLEIEQKKEAREYLNKVWKEKRIRQGSTPITSRYQKPSVRCKSRLVSEQGKYYLKIIFPRDWHAYRAIIYEIIRQAGKILLGIAVFYIWRMLVGPTFEEYVPGLVVGIIIIIHGLYFLAKSVPSLCTIFFKPSVTIDHLQFIYINKLLGLDYRNSLSNIKSFSMIHFHTTDRDKQNPIVIDSYSIGVERKYGMEEIIIDIPVCNEEKYYIAGELWEFFNGSYPE